MTNRDYDRINKTWKQIGDIIGAVVITNLGLAADIRQKGDVIEDDAASFGDVYYAASRQIFKLLLDNKHIFNLDNLEIEAKEEVEK